MVFPKWASGSAAKNAVKSLGGVVLWILGVVVVVLALSLMRESDGPLLADEDDASGHAVSQKALYEGAKRGYSGGPQAAEGGSQQTAGEYSSTVTEAPPAPPQPLGEPTEEVPLPASVDREGAESLASLEPSTPTEPALSESEATGVEPPTAPFARYDDCHQQLCMQPQSDEIRELRDTDSADAQAIETPPNATGMSQADNDAGDDTDSADAQRIGAPPNTTGVSQAGNDAGGVPDPADHCPSAAKPDQLDTDEGGIVEACDSEPENETT